jgi:hypothetical protein
MEGVSELFVSWYWSGNLHPFCDFNHFLATWYRMCYSILRINFVSKFACMHDSTCVTFICLFLIFLRTSCIFLGFQKGALGQHFCSGTSMFYMLMFYKFSWWCKSWSDWFWFFIEVETGPKSDHMRSILSWNVSFVVYHSNFIYFEL